MNARRKEYDERLEAIRLRFRDSEAEAPTEEPTEEATLRQLISFAIYSAMVSAS